MFNTKGIGKMMRRKGEDTERLAGAEADLWPGGRCAGSLFNTLSSCCAT